MATEISQLPQIFVQSQQAFSDWSNLTVGERVSYISQFLNHYIAHRDQIAQSISLEIGKAITHSYTDIDYDI